VQGLIHVSISGAYAASRKIATIVVASETNTPRGQKRDPTLEADIAAF